MFPRLVCTPRSTFRRCRRDLPEIHNRVIDGTISRSRFCQSVSGRSGSVPPGSAVSRADRTRRGDAVSMAAPYRLPNCGRSERESSPHSERVRVGRSVGHAHHPEVSGATDDLQSRDHDRRPACPRRQMPHSTARSDRLRTDLRAHARQNLNRGVMMVSPITELRSTLPTDITSKLGLCESQLNHILSPFFSS